MLPVSSLLVSIIFGIAEKHRYTVCGSGVLRLYGKESELEQIIGLIKHNKTLSAK